MRTEEARNCAKELEHVIQQTLSSNHDLSNRVRSLETTHGLASEYGSMKSRGQECTLDDNISTRSHIYGMASQLPITRTMSFSYTFEKDLQTSPVYSRTNRKHSMLSLPSSAARTTGWSVFSGISLSEVSNLSVFALPISVYELYNKQAYTNDLQRPPVDARAGKSKRPDSEITQAVKVVILGKTKQDLPQAANFVTFKRAVNIDSYRSVD